MSYELFSSDGKMILQLNEKFNNTPDFVENISPQTEIFFIVDGRCRFEIGSKTIIDAASGDILFFKSLRSHRITEYNKLFPFKTISIKFDMVDFIVEDLKALKKDDISSFLVDENNIIIRSDTSSAGKIQNLIFDIRDELQSICYGSESVIRSQILLVLSLAFQFFNSKDIVKVKPMPHADDIKRTMKYINENLDKDLKLEDLARIARMNRSYYTTMFKKITGMTTWEYILNLRVESATAMLLENRHSLNINDISEKCGFNSMAHFNKTFKTFTGKTPTEFKNQVDKSCFSE